MSAYIYAMDAVLYMTTGMLDRHDRRHHAGNGGLQGLLLGNGLAMRQRRHADHGRRRVHDRERDRPIFRDSRINLIVEGANEVMRSFIFAYGGKQLAEKMLGVQQAVGWDHAESPTQNLSRILRGLGHRAVVKAASPPGAELYLAPGRCRSSRTSAFSPGLSEFAQRLESGVASVSLSDSNGKNRIVLQVAKDGTPSLAFFDAQGRMVQSLVPTR